ncbi:hypothetical protein LBMAG42_45100 [Deltaproteobacteria bacterium]|nr:hypothetical protein LBMAG42_45100 [Deltaproteobacteria bacterium]
MKILAIRGKNLASLPELDLPFNTGHLANAGTFAISGPTGAGKSTIFDALCLALFGRTPRYGGGGHLVGEAKEEDEEKLKSGDPRGILRRGTGEGWAEADFTDREGNAYRARWTIRRAGKRSTGRMQPALHSIQALPSGDMLVSGLGPVAEWMGKNVGLTLEQFTRSVMLPQGEFAAFLKADAKDRASLLEKVTNSEEYRAIGKKAFDRWREESGKLKEITLQQEGILVMQPEERAAAEAALQTTQEAAASAKIELEAASAAVAWFQRREALGARVAEAQAAVTQAEAAWTAAGVARGDLERTDLVEPHRAAVEAARAGLSRAAEAERGSMAAAAAAAAAREQYEVATASAATAASAAAAAGQALAHARPLLDEARTRDARLVELTKQATAAQNAANQAANDLAASRVACTQAETSLNSLRLEASAAATWLAAHAEVAGLAERWTLAEKLLADFGSAKAELSKLTAARVELAAAVNQTAGAAAGALGKAKAEAEKHAAAVGELAAAEVAAATPSPAALADARTTVDAARARLQRLGALAHEAERAATDAEQARIEASTARAQAATHRATAEASGTRIAELTPRLDEATRTRDQALQTCNLAIHRPALVEGEACPLCGALEHPFAALPPALDALLSELKARVIALTADLANEATSRAQALAHASAADTLAQRADGRAQETTAAEARLTEAWRAEGREDQPRDVALAPERADLQRLASALAGMEERAKLARAAEAEARRVEREARAAKEAAEVAQRQAHAAAEAAALALQRNVEAAAAQSERQDAALGELAPSFTGWAAWEARLHADPTGFRDQRKDDVASFRSRISTRDRANEGIGKAEVEVAGLTKRTAEIGATATDTATTATAQRALLATEQGERAALLNGESADAVERRLTEAASATGEAAKEAHAASQKAGETSAALTASAEAARLAAGSLRTEADSFVAARDEALAGIGFGLPEAEARLARDPRTVKAERVRLAELTRVLVEARLALQSREGDLRVHDAAGRPEMTPEIAEAQRAEAQERADSATRNIGGLQQALRADDEARARQATFGDEKDRLTAVVHRWSRLREVIGDANGSVFSKFAQSITLNLLVAQANVQLAMLAPRYRLQRVPNLDLELQVIDLDNADDVRPLTSLSGGETFLASLALALGLAAIASKGLKIGSLFIDEGFGTLDAETLKVAISVLEGLRASGRQVGVISHVEGLADQLGAGVYVKKVTSTRSELQIGPRNGRAED